MKRNTWNCCGTKGGLALLWQRDLNISMEIVFASIIMVCRNYFHDY